VFSAATPISTQDVERSGIPPPAQPRHLLFRLSLQVGPCGKRQQGKRDDPERRITYSGFLGHTPILSPGSHPEAREIKTGIVDVNNARPGGCEAQSPEFLSTQANG